jgi:hypothetical protein
MTRLLRGLAHLAALLGLAAWAIALGRWLRDPSAGPSLVGLVVLTAFVVLALWRRAPLSSCGCFGGSSVAPTPLHAGIDAGFAAIGFVAATDAGPAAIDVLRDGGSDALTLAAGAIALAAVVYWVFTRWPGSRSAR